MRHSRDKSLNPTVNDDPPNRIVVSALALPGGRDRLFDLGLGLLHKLQTAGDRHGGLGTEGIACIGDANRPDDAGVCPIASPVPTRPRFQRKEPLWITVAFP